jgi:ubiquinone/menaquinone biosynthesis C-methylase UbiE
MATPQERTGYSDGRQRVAKRSDWKSAVEYLGYLRHFAAYKFAENYVRGKRALEVGCGTGYGSEHLSHIAGSIVSIDQWKEGIASCQKTISGNNISFIPANALDMPFDDESFDVVISFQVIEHFTPEDCPRYLNEIRRTLKRNGVFLATTPNKNLRLLPFQKQRNPEHMQEYNHKTLRRLLKAHFEEIDLLGLTATEEVMRTERKLLEQSPVDFYVRRPINKVTGKLRKAETKKQKEGWQPDIGMIDRVTQDDFKVNRDSLAECIDLYVVCVKK